MDLPLIQVLIIPPDGLKLLLLQIWWNESFEPKLYISFYRFFLSHLSSGCSTFYISWCVLFWKNLSLCFMFRYFFVRLRVFWQFLCSLGFQLPISPPRVLSVVQHFSLSAVILSAFPACVPYAMPFSDHSLWLIWFSNLFAFSWIPASPSSCVFVCLLNFSNCAWA